MINWLGRLGRSGVVSFQFVRIIRSQIGKVSEHVIKELIT